VTYVNILLVLMSGFVLGLHACDSIRARQRRKAPKGIGAYLDEVITEARDRLQFAPDCVVSQEMTATFKAGDTVEIAVHTRRPKRARANG
jgi:hypothetical protein